MQIRLKRSEVKVCRFCDNLAGYQLINNTLVAYCEGCQEYKGIITISQWEAINGMEFDF